jgi:lysophospholipase L1-like esterase
MDNDNNWSEAVTEVLVVGAIPTEIIIDNRDAETSQTGTWKVSGATDPYGADSVYSRDGATFTWHFTPTQSGNYEVSIWWTEWSSRSTSVPVDIEHSGGTTTVYINQQQNGGLWNNLGDYLFESGSSYNVTITAQPAPSSTCADAVRFNYLDEPIVNIVVPPSYYLQGSPDLSVWADANNLEVDWGIEFVLDIGTANEESIIDTTEPYEVVFAELTRSEHTLDAFVVDNSSTEVPGSYTHDQKIQIGIGDYYVAIGNSITSGYGDDDPSDDTSEDGRISRHGYTPILNDLLTTEKSIPHNIVNEAVGGTTSADGVSSIQAILANHTEAHFCLVQYGTNDGVPSGKGLKPGDSGYPGTFKDNMQQIIDAINDAGKEVCLAKPPIALGSTADSDPYEDPDQGTKSLWIKEYNQVIDELVNDPLNNISVAPPDFYSYFNYYDPSTNRYRYEDEYIDNLHPNGVGYHSMAQLWLESLTQTKAVIASITPNPAVIDEIVIFTGYGRTPDGAITGYSWESSIDGWLSDLSSFTESSLTQGTHTISFEVQDDEGIWSEAVTEVLVVGAIPTEIIIDNRDAETSQTGTWGVSGATDPYGADSVWSRDGATFTWHFTTPQSGNYEVSIWWTEWSSRSTSVPVDIEHSGGTTTVYINQQQNGGQWNSLDDYLFESGSSYNVTITAQPGPSSTCADAVKFNFIH